MKPRMVLLMGAVVLGTAVHASEETRQALIPQIDGRWWQVADNPMGHKYATERQEPVDFAVWQAADGTWQLWSCIRNTTAGGKNGKTRFFYRWQGKKLTDANWEPMGIAMEADPSLGETPGGLQAPHVVKIGDIYHMFYGDWVNICHATSKDGKDFTRVIRKNGRTAMFTECRHVVCLLYRVSQPAGHGLRPDNERFRKLESVNGCLFRRTSRDGAKLFRVSPCGQVRAPRVLPLQDPELRPLSGRKYSKQRPATDQCLLFQRPYDVRNQPRQQVFALHTPCRSPRNHSP
jgi:hypothetical protein